MIDLNTMLCTILVLLAVCNVVVAVSVFILIYKMYKYEVVAWRGAAGPVDDTDPYLEAYEGEPVDSRKTTVR